MVDLSKIKVGDEVTVRMVVKTVDTDGIFNASSSGGVHGWIDSSEIATHTPAPREFKPGETVYAGSATKWKIEHVNGFWAWIVDANGWNRLEALENLRHADESDDQ